MNVTEVYVTHVDKEQLQKFHAWHEKIHQMESSFPGFQRVYFQPSNQDCTWVTLLEFDTVANLEHWLQSPERASILKESMDFIKSKETHRLLSSFGGLFTDKFLPPRWKQTMLILAVLFPIVMVEYVYLAPHLNFNVSLKTFIQNVICVNLLAWPMVPFAIYSMKWWLEDPCKNLQGIAVMLLVYAAEIALFWHAA